MAHRQPANDQELPARIGDRVGHFVIESVLGRGGMGVVYRARDTELDCPVALKCPWPRLAKDPVNRRRFLREARAASKLAHPHIVPIREVFEEGDLPWLVMTLVEGRTLRDLIASEGRLPVKQVLRLAEDLASALDFAHTQKILHRDVTPGNVIATAGGGAMLTDFGLAAFIEPDDGSASSTTRATVGTRDGEVLGTPAYRSPEQAMGRRLDARSDLFSLGAVIYEMCTARPAFQPTAEGDTTYAILNREPVPVGRRNHEVPEELERIIRKSMAKEPGERYRSAGDLLVDLRTLRHRMEFTEYLKTHPDANATRRSVLAAVVGATLAVTVLTLVWYFVLRPEGQLVDPGMPVQVTTGPAWEGQPALSPDGTRVAYASDASGNLDIYVADVRGGEPLRITDDPGIDAEPAWSPDASFIAFTSDRGGAESIWKVGPLGGGATLLVAEASSPAISPDGTRIAFTKEMPGGERRIGVSGLDDPGRVAVLTTDEDGLWWHGDPAWSPDGRTIAYRSHRCLWTVSADGGGGRRLVADDGVNTEPVWTPDGSHILYSSLRGGVSSIWRVSVRSGATRRLTLGMGPESHPSISADGSRLGYTTQSTESQIVLLDRRTGESTAISGLRDVAAPALAPDGSKMVFVSNMWGTEKELWVQSLAHGHPDDSPRQLTDQAGIASHPVYSPDGKWIAYYRILGERRNICIVPAGGGASIPYTDDDYNNIHPAWSPDGRKLAFVSERGGASGLWVAGVEEGRRVSEPVAVPTGEVSAYAPCWSPDGRLIAFLGVRNTEFEIWTVTADGSADPVQVTRGAHAFRVRWEPAGDRLLVSGFWGEKEPSMHSVAGDGSGSERVSLSTPFGVNQEELYFDISPDGSLLAYVYGRNRGDIWVLVGEPGTY